MSATRRQILAGTGALGVGAGIAFTGALSDLFAGTAVAQGLGHDGYGPSSPTRPACSTSPRASATGSSPARANHCSPVRVRCPRTTTA